MLCRERVVREELMDAPETRIDEIDMALRDLAFANRWFGGYAAARPHIARVLRDGYEYVKVLDIACGSGDVSKVIIDEARRSGARIEVIGLDVNPKVLALAREWSGGYPELEFVRGDARRLPFPNKSFDLVFSSTFLHHLDPDEVVKVLSEARRVCRGLVVVSDLVRSSLAYIGIWLFGRLFFGRVSRADGPASICKAYLPADLHRFGLEAGFKNCEVFSHRFYRMALICSCEDV